MASGVPKLTIVVLRASLIAFAATALPLKGQDNGLSADRIRNAIRAGTGDPLPIYALKWRRAGVTTAATVGRVYTPWWRIASYAHAQAESGHPIDNEEQVPADLKQPVIVVAFFEFSQWQSVANSEASIEVIPHNAGDRASGAKPVWIRRGDIASWDFTEHPPVAAAAAFDAALIHSGVDIILRAGTYPQFAVVRGTVDSNDLMAWR